MCRSIRTLYHLDPPTDRAEIEAAARQFVRKVSGFSKPSQKNAEVFERAIAEVTKVTERLFDELETGTPPRDRELLAEKARARAAKRYGREEERRG